MENQLVSYFETWDTEDLLEVVNSFCYTDDYDNLNSLQFIEDHELGLPIKTMLYDKSNPDAIFLRSSRSHLQVLDEIKISLLSIGYKRLLHERGN